MQDLVDEGLDALGQLAHLVALLLEVAERLVDGAEDVEVGGGADVALVGREGKDSDGDLLVLVVLAAQARPLDRALAQHVDAVSLRDGAAGDAITAGEDDRLDGTVELWEGDLKGDLHRVQAELRVLPLLKGLEGGRHRAQVGAVEALQRGDGLGMVLRGGAAHERKAGEVDHHVDGGLTRGVEEVRVDAEREVERARVRGHDERALGLHLHDERDVVRVVARVYVRLLQHDADDGRCVHVDAHRGRVLGTQPRHVLVVRVEDARCHRVPDAFVGDDLGRNDLNSGEQASVGDWLDVVARQVEQQRLDVLRRATQPVLQRHHEGASVLGLVAGQVLEHLRVKGRAVRARCGGWP